MNDLNIPMVEKIMNGLIEGEVYTHAQSINYLIDRMGAFALDHDTHSQDGSSKGRIEC